MLDALGHLVERRGVVLLPALATGAVAPGLGPDEGIAAGNGLGFLVYFAAGVVLAAYQRFRAAVRRDAVLAGVPAVALMLIAGAALLLGGEGELLLDRDPLTLVGRAAFGATGWCAALAVIGGMDRRRASSDRRGRRLAGAVGSPAMPPLPCCWSTCCTS